LWVFFLPDEDKDRLSKKQVSCRCQCCSERLQLHALWRSESSKRKEQNVSKNKEIRKRQNKRKKIDKNKPIALDVKRGEEEEQPSDDARSNRKEHCKFKPISLRKPNILVLEVIVKHIRHLSTL
jgi:hypothetical protein